MIQWNASFVTGHAFVDHDHQKLIATLNELEAALKNGAGKEQITQIVTFLSDYARDHFAREEVHMQRVACPAYKANCHDHAAFLSRLDGWLKQLHAGPSTALVLDVYRETSTWIRGHILRIDCQLRQCRGPEMTKTSPLFQ
jgi:hemerythrin-like metal-binding protein